MRKFLNEKVYSMAEALELMISMLLIVVICITGIRVAIQVLDANTYQEAGTALNRLLGEALSLAVGVEFIKMLCQHKPSTVIEVLLFATARQMVVEHLDPFMTLLGIVSIAALFATRKYLFCSFDEVEKTVYRGNQRVRIVNALLRLDIPFQGNETLEDLIKRELDSKGEDLGLGACIYYHGYALRVAGIHDGEHITRVEVIRSTNEIHG